MKALVLEAYKKLVFREVTEPEPKSNEVKIRVKATGICGSDVHGYDGSSGRRIPPVIMGHESSGIIEEVGPEVIQWRVGDRVTFDSTIYDLNDWYTTQGLYNLSDNRKVLGVSCQEYKQDGAFAEYIILPEHILHSIPDNVSYEEASLTEPIAVAIHAVNIGESRPEDKVMVVGNGIIGLLIVQVLKASGYNQIISVDIDPSKLELAKKLGASTVLNPEIENIQKNVGLQTANRGVDCVYEAVGIQNTINTSFSNVRKGGTIVLVGNITPSVKMPLQKIVTEQITIKGSCAINGEYPEALKLLEDKKISTNVLISKIVPLSKGPEWFERLYNKEKGLLKVILTP